MIRWEEQPDGNWLGYSGQALVATATKSGERRWDWEVPGAGKRKGWRSSGHRTDELEARRAADAYWDRWLKEAALRPDLSRLAEESLPSKPRKSRKSALATPAPEPARTSGELDAANTKLREMQRALEAAQKRADEADERATAAEERAAAAEKREQASKARLAKLRDALSE